jgi:hypothetical protein
MVYLLLLLSTKPSSNSSVDSREATAGVLIVHSPSQTRHVPSFETVLWRSGGSAVTWRACITTHDGLRIGQLRAGGAWRSPVVLTVLSGGP